MSENFGVKVFIKFTSYPFAGGRTLLRNVTEIHYKYPGYPGNRIAFESDIHQTGMTYALTEIAEFETFPETEKAESF